jgi:hypothetical protein
MGFRKSQEAVKIIGDSLHSCYVKNQNHSKSRCAGAIAGMLLLKELMPSWMNYASLLREGILGRN